jgi:hypothetical protein
MKNCIWPEMCALIFSTTVSENVLRPERMHRDIFVNTLRFSREVPQILTRF